jgi:hypothetical protein
MNASQCLRVQRYLAQGKPLTQRQASDRFGIDRLAARVHTLRKQGWPILSEIVKRNGKKFSRYWIDTENVVL